MNKNINALGETTVIWTSKDDFETNGVAWFEKLGFTLSPINNEVTELRNDGYNHYILSEELRFILFPEGGFIEMGYLTDIEKRGYQPLRGEKYYGFAHFREAIGEDGWSKTAFQAKEINREYFRLARQQVDMHGGPLYYNSPRYLSDGRTVIPKDAGAVFIPGQIEPTLFTFITQIVRDSEPDPVYIQDMMKLMNHPNGVTQVSNVLIHNKDFSGYASRMEVFYEFDFEKSATRWTKRFPETGQRLTIVNDEGLAEELGDDIRINRDPCIVAPYMKVPSISVLKDYFNENDVPFEERNGRLVTRRTQEHSPGLIYIFEESA